MLPATYKIMKLFNVLVDRNNASCRYFSSKELEERKLAVIAVYLRVTVLLRFFTLRETVNNTDTRHSSDRRMDIAVKT